MRAMVLVVAKRKKNYRQCPILNLTAPHPLAAVKAAPLVRHVQVGDLNCQFLGGRGVRKRVHVGAEFATPHAMLSARQLYSRFVGIRFWDSIQIDPAG